MKTKLLTAITTEKNSDKLYEKLVKFEKKSPELFSRRLFRGRTVFHQLIMHQHYTVLKALLEDERLKALACQTDQNKQSILHLAILYYLPDNREHLEWLTDLFPMMINGKDSLGNTPLHLAVSHERLEIPQKIEIILCLVKHSSCNRWIVNELGKTPFTLDKGGALSEALRYVDVSRIPMPPLDGQLLTAERESPIRFSEQYPHLFQQRRPLKSCETPRTLESSSSSSTVETLSASMGDDSISGAFTARECRSAEYPPVLETPLQVTLADYCLKGNSLKERRALRKAVFTDPDGLNAIHRAIRHVNWYLQKDFQTAQENKTRLWHGFLRHLVRQGLLTPPTEVPLSPEVQSPDSGIDMSLALNNSLWLISTSREREGTPRLFTLEKILHQTLGLQLQADLPTLVSRLTTLLKFGDAHQRMVSTCMIWLLVHFNPLSAFRTVNNDVIGDFLCELEVLLDKETADMLDDFQTICRRDENNLCRGRALNLAQWPLDARFQAKPMPLKKALSMAMNVKDPHHLTACDWIAHDAYALSSNSTRRLTPDELRDGLALEVPCAEQTPILYLQTQWWQSLSEHLSKHGLSGDVRQLQDTMTLLTNLAPAMAGASSEREPDIHGLMCLSSVLNHQSVSRAMEAHCSPDMEQHAVLRELGELLSSQKNRANIRRCQQVFPNTLPFVGHLKSDLLFAAQGAAGSIARAEAQGKVLFTLLSLKMRLGFEVQPVYTTLQSFHLSESPVPEMELDKLSHRFKPWPASIYDFCANPLPLPETPAEAIETLNVLHSEYLAFKIMPPKTFEFLEHVAILMKSAVQKTNLSASDLTALARLIPLYHQHLNTVMEVDGINRRIPCGVTQEVERHNPLRLIYTQLTLPPALRSSSPLWRFPQETDKGFPARLRPFFSNASRSSEASSSAERRSPRAS